MRVIIGVFGIIAGILLGLYVGLYVCFIGGLVDIATEVANIFKGVEFSALGFALGVVKFFLSGLAGYMSAFVVILPSAVMLGLKKKNRK